MKLAIALALILFGCGVIIPNYYPDKLGVQPAEILIKIAPNYPHICTDSKDPLGRAYRTVTMYVYLRGQDPAPVSVLINKVGLMEATSGSGHTFRYPAGVGLHRIEIWVKSDPVQYLARNIIVQICGPQKKNIEPYRDDR